MFRQLKRSAVYGWADTMILYWTKHNPVNFEVTFTFTSQCLTATVSRLWCEEGGPRCRLSKSKRFIPKRGARQEQKTRMSRISKILSVNKTRLWLWYEKTRLWLNKTRLWLWGKNLTWQYVAWRCVRCWLWVNLETKYWGGDWWRGAAVEQKTGDLSELSDRGKNMTEINLETWQKPENMIIKTYNVTNCSFTSRYRIDTITVSPCTLSSWLTSA